MTKFLTPELRDKLKSPFGHLIRGTPHETMRRLRGIITARQPKKIIIVGDIVARNVLQYNIRFDVMIVDNMTMRKPIVPIMVDFAKNMVTMNPAGSITEEAGQTIEDAMVANEKCVIIVEGEEDLLALQAILSAPDGSLVIYGQPMEGIVIVDVTTETRNKAIEMTSKMRDQDLGR